MRVMLFSRFFYSGQTTHVVELATELARQGHVVSVMTHGRCHRGAWEHCAVRLHRHGIKATAIGSPADAAAEAKAFAPDVVHVHSSDLIPLGSVLARSTGAPLIVTCHGLGVARAVPEVRDADAVIAVGPRVYQDLAHGGVVRLEMIPNGVDTRRFRPGTKGRSLRVVYLGRVDAAKRRGLQELVEAVAAIPGARLFVASNERPRHPRCVALGWVWDAAPLLAAGHVVAGAGRGIREGMAAGCVGLLLNTTYGGIVGPDTPGAADGRLWLSGTDGAPPDRHAIRRDLLRLAQDDESRRALARWSREYACRQFSLEAMSRQVVALYRKALARRGAPV